MHIPVDKMIASYRVFLEAANRHLALFPTREALDYRYAWLRGAFMALRHIGVDASMLGESPNHWRDGWAKAVPAEQRPAE
jgi:hypothetical protein